jgi:hypothetical protein
MVFKKFIHHMFLFPISADLQIINFIFCWGMNIRNNDIIRLPAFVVNLTYIWIVLYKLSYVIIHIL